MPCELTSCATMAASVAFSGALNFNVCLAYQQFFLSIRLLLHPTVFTMPCFNASRCKFTVQPFTIAVLSLCAGVYAVLGRRRARVVLEEIREGSDLFSIHAFLPAQASFGFANDMRRQSSGDALSAHFCLWAVVLCELVTCYTLCEYQRGKERLHASCQPTGLLT